MTHAWTVLVVVGTLVAFHATPGAAKIYRWVDPNGNVMFSDRPPQPGEVGGAEKDRGPSRPDGRQQPDSLQAIDEVLELSGIRPRLAMLGDHIQAGVRRQPGSLSAEEQAAIGRITTEAFRAESIYALLRAEFGKNLDADKLDDMLTWFRSPLGRRITALEVATQTAQGRGELERYAAQARQSTLPRERAVLLQRLDAAKESSDIAVEMVVLVAGSLARAADPLLPPERRLRAGQLQADLGQIRARAAQPVREAVLVQMLYTYRSLADRDLQEYLRLAESPPGRWFSTTVKTSLLDTIRVGSERMAGDLVRLVPPERWSRSEFKKPPLPY